MAWEKTDERPEVDIEVPAEVTYELPAGRPPFRTTVRAVTSGPEVRLYRTQPIGYCHSGESLLQHAVVSVALMGADGPWPLRICSRTATTRGPTALARARRRRAG